MKFKEAAQAGTFLTEYRALVHRIEQAVQQHVRALVVTGKLPPQYAKDYVEQLAVHARHTAASLWNELLESDEAIPVPTAFDLIAPLNLPATC